jgi:hypothetical protein
VSAPVIDGHLVVTTLAGNATVTVHRHLGPFCIPLLSMVLDPADVLRLADELTQASVPPPPVVKRRIKVRLIDKPLGTWGFDCPECFGTAGSWMDQQGALAAAYRHISREHASEVTR